MKLNVFKTEEEVLESLAEYFITVAQKSITPFGRFSVALSGGSSPKKLYELLSSFYNDKLDWSKVYFFFGDERFVPHTDPDSNFLMAKKTLFDPLGIPEAQIFRVDTSVEPAPTAQKYSEVITDFFRGEDIKIDLVLLGLGDDAHTASLFPDTDVLHDVVPAAKAVYLESKNVYRITLNAPLINDASHIAFLVYGKSKAIAVHNVIEGPKQIDNFPAQLVDPKNGELQWFLDEAAASNLRSYAIKAR